MGVSTLRPTGPLLRNGNEYTNTKVGERIYTSGLVVPVEGALLRRVEFGSKTVVIIVTLFYYLYPELVEGSESNK